MSPYFEADGIRLFLGDCREVMRSLPAESMDAIVTDPPYGLEFMGGFRCIGIDNNEEYLSHAAERLRLGDEGLAQVVAARRQDAEQAVMWDV
jgi:hypothetical protein